MTTEAIKAEIVRRIAKYRLGSDTYPDLSDAADALQHLLDWIESKEKER
jgi:hypothetical protein